MGKLFDHFFRGNNNDNAAPSLASRRKFLCSCGCGALTISAAGMGLLSAATKAEAAAGGALLRVSHLPAGCVSHLLLAKARGLFQKAGLTVELSQLNGPAEALQGLVADSFDVIHSPWTATIAAYEEGNKELRIVGGSGQAGIELVARKGSVTSVEEFIAAAGKGLRVGTLRLDTLELVGYGTMSKHGKSYSDYNMTFFPSMVGMGEAIANGALDVVTLAQPYAENVVRNAGATYLTDSNSVWGPEAADCVVTSKADVVAGKHEVIQAYLKVLKEVATLLNADYDAALNDLQQIYGVEKDILAVALKRQFPNPVISPAGVDGLKNGVKYLIELGYLKTNIIDDVLDLRYQPA